MAARGKAVSSAVSSGRHEITKGMRKTRSIGQDIEWWWKVSEVHIPDTKNALYRAFLDSLNRDMLCEVKTLNISDSELAIRRPEIYAIGTATLDQEGRNTGETKYIDRNTQQVVCCKP